MSCAIVDPFLVTVNTVFLQLVEHIDSDGLLGNMTDVLLLLESEPKRKRYEVNASLNHPIGLAANRCIPRLLVPPEHRVRIQPILQKIQDMRLFEGGLGNQG